MKKRILFFVKTVLVLVLAFTAGISAVNGSEKNVCAGSGLEIGQEYQGGIIAYLDATGKHGLIAAPEDIGTAQWYSGQVSLVTTGAEIGAGKSNTTRIVQLQDSSSYAARLCDDLVLNGYDDWFLPSKDELNLLYQHRLEIGGFDYTGIYWSSTEESYNTVWYQYFGNGYQYYYYKYYACKVRAVRAF